MFSLKMWVLTVGDNGDRGQDTGGDGPGGGGD